MKNTKQNLSKARAIPGQRIFTAILAVIIFSCATVSAQSFSKVTTYTLRQRNIIAFTVSREANIRCYNIEASNDTFGFTTIAKVKSRGNTVIPREYRLDITGHNYKYYRIAEVFMNWQNEYSAVIKASENEIRSPRIENIPSASQIATVTSTQ